MKNVHAVLLPVLVQAVAIFIPKHSFAQSDYSVTERGADYAVHQKTVVENGTNRVHSYTELATGLNYTNSYGQLVESKEEIDVLPHGGAAATQGRHKVYFPGDISSGVIEVVTPDGLHLKSRPLGISYDDGTNTVLIGQLTNSIGVLVSSNQVVYPNAFTGLDADLRYTYRKGGFEQDIVLQEQPPTPESFGLSSQNARLQVLTEFFNPPEPKQTKFKANLKSKVSKQTVSSDTTLTFGKMKMVQGRAFAMNSESGKRKAETSAVSKSWVHLQGRTFLIEELPVTSIATQLQQLPVPASATVSSANTLLHKVSATRLLPPIQMAQPAANTMQLARAGMNYKSGVVLDYDEIDSDTNDFTFVSGMTYFISSFVTLSGTTTIEGGAVIKYGSDSGGIAIDGTNLICSATPDNRTIFTTEDDDSVGDIIPGSTGNPATNCYGGPIFLTGESGSVFNLSNLSFFYQSCAVNYDGYDGFGENLLELFNVRANDCNQFMFSAGGCIDFQNCLFANIEMVLPCDDTSATAENVTLDDCGYFSAPYDGGGSSLDVTNCLFANVPAIPDNDYPFSDISEYTADHTVILTSDAGVFQTAANASNYLASSSSYRDAGTTNIDPGLLAEIQTMTTYAPQDGGFPDTNTPDIGYHYPTNEDSDFDGIPDWWIWKYFHSYAFSGTNYDSGGNTLLYDYENGLDPNVIQFSIETTNDYANTTNVSVQLNITGGVPSYYAIFANSTTATNWLAFTTTNLTVNLGSTDGVYTVNVGLRGLPSDAQQTWQSVEFIKDTVAPLVTITNPVSGTVNQPLIQLEGYASKSLGGLFFDVSNAVGVVSNQQGFVTDQYYDTNLWKLTTNYFQCFDITLTNGLNKITLRATDLAGNMTTVITNFMLDYSTATNPAVSLTWPTNGMQICGSSFTLRGTVDDPSAMVTASITDTNGNTSTLIGEVERTGVLWVENLPLAEGTNWLTLWVTNSAGLSSETNITLVKNDMTLALTNIDGDLWNPVVNVSGIISDSSDSVWVNGVQGTNNGNGTWSAANVPVSSSGVASFDMKASSSGGGDPDGNLNTNKQDRLYMDNDTQNTDTYDHWRWTAWGVADDTNPADASNWEEVWNTSQSFQTWNDGIGGGGSSFNQHIGMAYDNPGSTNLCTEKMIWPPTNWESYASVCGTGTFTGDCTTNPNVPQVIVPQVITCEYCDENDPYGPVSTYYGYVPHFYDSDWESYAEDGTYTRHVQTKWKLKTGGLAIPHRENLFCITAWAKDVEAVLGKRAQPPYPWADGGLGTEPLLPYASITIGSLGQLHSDGSLWLLLPDGATPYVATPQVGKPFYIFNVEEQKYTLSITANGIDLYTNIPEFCVGQQIDLVANWNPSLPDGTQKWPQWTLGGDFIDNFYYPSGCTTCSMVYTNDPTYLTNESSQAWWIWGDYDNPPTYMADFSEDLMLPNGQRANMAALGKIKMFRPKVSIFVETNTAPSFYAASGNFLDWNNVATVSLGGDNDPRQDGYNHEMNYYVYYDTGDYSGSGGITQLIQASYSGPPALEGYSFSEWRLDGNTELYSPAQGLNPEYPEAESVFFSDAPENGHTYAAGTVKCIASFQDYCRFKPDGGIFVTLGIINWSCDGESPYAWFLSINSVTGPLGPDSSDAFPIWQNVLSGGSNQ